MKNPRAVAALVILVVFIAGIYIASGKSPFYQPALPSAPPADLTINWRDDGGMLPKGSEALITADGKVKLSASTPWDHYEADELMSSADIESIYSILKNHHITSWKQNFDDAPDDAEEDSLTLVTGGKKYQGTMPYLNESDKAEAEEAFNEIGRILREKFPSWAAFTQ